MLALEEHLGYVTDVQRNHAYRDAIATAVREGDVVADLGAGTGILALMCLEAGARHVYLVERSEAMLEVASRSLAEAGFSGRFTPLAGSSQQLELPELADVAICDHVGFFAVDYGICPLLSDARRLLRAGGRILPQGAWLHMAPVEVPALFERAHAWGSGSVPAAFHWLADEGLNSAYPAQLEAGQLLGPESRLGYVEFSGGREFHRFDFEATCHREGELQGLAGWFDCVLTGDVNMTNAPFDPRRIDRAQAFFPLPEAVHVTPGTQVRGTLMLRPLEGELLWNLRVANRQFKISLSPGFGPEARGARAYRLDEPRRLVAAVRLEQQVLAYCDGESTPSEIEALMLQHHSHLCPTPNELRRAVHRVLLKHTEPCSR